MVVENGLVSVIMPTKNSGEFLRSSLISLRNQSYPNIEIIVIDGDSQDETLDLASEFECKVFQFDPHLPSGRFDAPYRRNYGSKQATGSYIYYLDADMELMRDVIKEAVDLCEFLYDAVIIPEDSFGSGVWAKAKNLERRCYWGDNLVEAPRFFRKNIWNDLGGLDQDLGGGGDDWDLREKALEKGYQIGRTKSMVIHHEGKLKLGKLCKKRFMYGRDSLKYIRKRPRSGIKSYWPIRGCYFRSWRLFMERPLDSLFFIFMRVMEYAAGGAGVIFSFLRKD